MVCTVIRSSDQRLRCAGPALTETALSYIFSRLITAGRSTCWMARARAEFSARHSGLPATVYAAPVLVCAVTPDPTTGCPQGNSVGITDPLLNGTANPANGVVTTPFH